jgi:hypothetical protein
MIQETSYASYLLRVWREDDGQEGWQGEIESIQTGQTWRFADLITMAHFLQAQVLGKPVTELAPEHNHAPGCE